MRGTHIFRLGPSITLPRIQPPVVQWEYMPRRQYRIFRRMRCRRSAPDRRGEGCDADADGIDDADPFMAKDAARRTGRDIALQDVQVSSADGGLEDLHDRIARRLDLRLRTIFDPLSGPARDRLTLS